MVVKRVFVDVDVSPRNELKLVCRAPKLFKFMTPWGIAVRILEGKASRLDLKRIVVDKVLGSPKRLDYERDLGEVWPHPPVRHRAPSRSSCSGY